MKIRIMIGLAAIALMAGCATSKTTTEYSQLPAPVQNTIKQQCPNSQIAKIEYKKHKGCCVYKVEFCAPGKNPKMYINPDGSIQSS